MNIRCDRNFQIGTNWPKTLATFARSHPAKRCHRRPLSFIVGGFEDKIDIFLGADLGDASCHSPNKLLRFDHARPENEYWPFSANGKFAHAKRFHSAGEVCSLRARS